MVARDSAGYDRDALLAGLMAASALTDPAAVADLTVRHVRDVCGTEAAALYWWDHAENVLLPLAVLDPLVSGVHQVFHPGQGATGQAFAKGKPVLSNSYPEGVDFPPAGNVNDGTNAIAAVPLWAAGEVVGVLTVTQRWNAQVTARDVDAMRVIGDQIAPLLHSMRALAHAQFRLAEARELTALIRDTASATEAGPLLARICAVSCRMLGAEFAVLSQPLYGGGQHIRTAYGTLSDPDSWAPGDITWSGERGDATVRIDVLADADPGDVMPILHLEQTRTALAIPLVVSADDIVGVLLLGWRFPVDPSNQLVSLGRTLAASATSLLARERTEGALRNSETMWRVTLDNAPVGICLITLDGDFRLVNAAMTRILGYTEEDLLSRNFVSITLPSHVYEKQELLRRLLAGDFPSGTLHTQCIHADGHNVWTSLSAQVVPAERGGETLFSVQLEDITFQHDQNAQLMHLATHDSLTGLANRRLFQEFLDRRISASEPTIVALIDIPDLHGLEDRYGHAPAAGVVRELADRLNAVLAASVTTGGDECVARLGSDEFAVMLAADGIMDAEKVVTARLMDAFRDPVVVNGRTHRLPVHIGVAVSPDDGATAQDLMHSADIALTEARRDGRPVRQHSADLRSRVTHRERLTIDLRDALAAGDLALAFQPIVDAATGSISAAEALARWTHPEYGPIPPDVFVPLAEESGLMPRFTAWAVENALRACADWQQHKPSVGVAVNLSATDLQTPGIAQSIAAALALHGVPPALLELELTETTVMTDIATAQSILASLSELGVGLGIDDFGTGYSSLSYLQRLPVVTLKIDRSFVTSMLTDPSNSAIVTMVLQLARTLGMGTVAEGVEDRPTVERLAQMKCDRIQGYVIARPMPEAEFRIWLP